MENLAQNGEYSETSNGLKGQGETLINICT